MLIIKFELTTHFIASVDMIHTKTCSYIGGTSKLDERDIF